MTLKCDLVCVAESYVLHIVSLRGTSGWSLNENLPKDSGDMEWTHNSRVYPLTCDLESR